ncbi:MAG: molecular chaperone HtpG [Flavobacteriales bacterium]|nr:molecular chaperone HtpG [Flavobacteriales bacterium]
MQQGSIHVQTENIFPIIKKFLYSDHEIFLRELVSNAVDATQKVKTLKGIGELNYDLDKLKVQVILDKEAGTLTVRDNGIGMTNEEVDKYINQIAFSGAEEFVEKYKDADGSQAIIGHFGLGFYSAFMVSDKVEIISKSHKTGSTPVRWECDGSPNYSMEETTKKTKGTDIVLHISEDSKEFLEEGRIGEILNKYCKFMPVDIQFGMTTEYIDSPTGEKDEDGNLKRESVEVENIINNKVPAWTKKPVDLNEEDYQNFYRELYPMNFEDPLFHIHLNVDFPFNLTGVLYFPKLTNQIEVNKNKIHLYSNQVFITDNVENIVPEYLTLLHGVIDSPDIPLNVSRSYLQEDGNVKKIASHISKKVSDKLNSMFKEDRKSFEEKWEDLKVFSEYGMLMEEKFFERAQVALYKNIDNEFFTFEEYKEKIGETQKDKNDKIIVLYTNDPEGQHTYINPIKERGYDVLHLDGPLVSHLMSKLESTNTDVQFKRVDANVVDKLIEKEDDQPSKLSEEQQEALKPVVEAVVNDTNYSVSFASMSQSDAPVLITQSEWMRRMKEQQAVGGGGYQLHGSLPDSYELVVNSNHPLVEKIVEQSEEDKKKNMLEQAIDLAKLSQGLLRGEKLTSFINRSIENIK